MRVVVKVCDTEALIYDIIVVIIAFSAKKATFLLDNTRLITKSYALLQTSICIAEMFRLFLLVFCYWLKHANVTSGCNLHNAISLQFKKNYILTWTIWAHWLVNTAISYLLALTVETSGTFVAFGLRQIPFWTVCGVYTVKHADRVQYLADLLIMSSYLFKFSYHIISIKEVANTYGYPAVHVIHIS